MKRLLLVVLFWTCLASAQVVGPGFVNYVTSAPSGSCSQGEPQRNVMGVGTIYTCQNGTWAQISGGGGSGTVTGVNGTTNQINSDGSTTTPTLSLSGTIVLPGTLSAAANGASSAAAVTLSGTGFVGTGTTSVPLFYLNAGTAPTTWSTGSGGTPFGINAPSGFAGNFIDFHLNGGVQLFGVSSNGSVTSAGGITAGASQSIKFAGRSIIQSGADGVTLFSNSTATGLTRLQLGLTTSSGPAFGISGTTITAQLGDGTAGGIFSASAYATVTNCGATGTSANPSVVTCTAAPSGSFACATNASTGTCTVNTTAVTTTSRILIQPTAAASTLTCNTTADTGLTSQRLASQVNGTSFTINLGAFTTTAECFNYWVIN